MTAAHVAVVPDPVRRALEQLLGESIAHVTVIEYSPLARLHGRAVATTRKERIYLRGSAASFFADPWLMLHEYCHVIHQWQPGSLTVPRYVLECLRRGYWNNRFEVEARAFADLHGARLAALLGLAPPGPRLSLTALRAGRGAPPPQ